MAEPRSLTRGRVTGIRRHRRPAAAGLLGAAISMAALISGCGSTELSSPAPTHTVVADVVERVTSPIRLQYPTTGPADPRQNFGDLYLPDHRHRHVPLVVMFHGGGWQVQGGSSRSLAPLARDLAARGVAVFNVEYRRIGSGGGWPTTLTDARDAVAFGDTLRQRFAVLDGPEVVVGHSAGAQLALWAAQHQQHPPRAVISLAGPLDMSYAAAHGDRNVRRFLGGLPRQEPARYAIADPSTHPDPAMPIVLLAGSRDRVVPPDVAQHYVEDVTSTRATISFDRLDGATHGSLVTRGGIGYDAVLAAIVRTAQAP